MEDSFSQLTDDLLIRILSFVPIKDAVVTSILSNRWLTRLKFKDRLLRDDEGHSSRGMLSSDFIFGALLLHKPPVVERFHLTRKSECSALQVELWVRFAVDRFVRDLKIDFLGASDHFRIRFPSGLFRCETLETLELNKLIFLDVPSRVSLPSLRTLRLIYLKYTDEESFIRLISISPVLENLDVNNSTMDHNELTFTINVPSLRNLTVFDIMEDVEPNDNLFGIHSHSLIHLDIMQEHGKFNIIGGMPELVVASLETSDSKGNDLESLTCVKRLYLSFNYEARHSIRTIFFQLVRLEFCGFGVNWADLLVCVLQHSPILEILKFEDRNQVCWDTDKDCLNPPSCAPECLLHHLKTFECTRNCEGTLTQKEVAIYILKHARRLVTATVSEHVFEELEYATRGLRACELIMG